MTTPMLGDWLVDLHAVKPFFIHGDAYFELHILRVDAPEAGLLGVRVPRHAIPVEPLPGMRLKLTFLMGQITAAEVVRGMA